MGVTDIIQQTGSVPAELAGERFDRVAAELFPDFSRSRLARWIREGSLTLDGGDASPSDRLLGGETLALDVELAPVGEVVPQAMELDIVFEDEALLVINKPADLVVHPAAGNPDGTLQNGLLHHDEALAAVPRAGIVHRLDKDTTGVMVVAKTLTAQASLSEQLQARTMSRRYQAVAWGELGQPGRVSGAIGRDPKNRQRMAVRPDAASGARQALTHFRPLRLAGGLSHLELKLETGRTHQIRVHLQTIGHPVVGDLTYRAGRGQPAQLPEPLDGLVEQLDRQALHAWRLQLQHPVTGRLMRFDAPLPDDIRGLTEAMVALGE